MTIEVLDLSAAYPSHDGVPAHQVLNGVSFTVPRQTVTAILGESGAGKSSVLKILAGLASAGQKRERLKILSGSAELEQKSLLKPRGKWQKELFVRLSYLAQNAGATLPAHLSVAEILAAKPRALDREVDINYLSEFIAGMFEIAKLPLNMLGSMPHELSKGQRQRVAVIRELATRPQLLLADEPTNGVDPLNRTGLAELLYWYKKEFAATMLIVCHDIEMLEKLVDDVVVMQAGQTVGSGKLIEVFQNPTHPYVQSLAAALRNTAYDEAASRKLSS